MMTVEPWSDPDADRTIHGRDGENVSVEALVVSGDCRSGGTVVGCELGAMDCRGVSASVFSVCGAVDAGDDGGTGLTVSVSASDCVVDEICSGCVVAAEDCSGCVVGAS